MVLPFNPNYGILAVYQLYELPHKLYIVPIIIFPRYSSLSVCISALLYLHLWMSYIFYIDIIITSRLDNVIHFSTTRYTGRNTGEVEIIWENENILKKRWMNISYGTTNISINAMRYFATIEFLINNHIFDLRERTIITNSGT